MRGTVEGGVTMFLTLIILFGAVAGGIALFGAGGWVRKRKIDESDADDAPPVHTVVENETRDVEFPRNPTTRPEPPE
jgi:hypothetical protein